VALREAIGLMTVADIRIICGLPAPLSAITRFAAWVLVTLESEVKLIRIVQLFPGLSVLGHSSTPRKPLESSPEIAAMLKLVKVIMDVPVLVSVVAAKAGMPT
jgi:hypothetical protein